MSELTPHQQKALDIQGHLALTANAGSGKTFVLARKYLSVLLHENVESTNVAAITFTEKAASELYFKISLLIDEQIKLSLKNDEKKKLQKIRRQLVSANISTIHSFCINILKEFPVEAQIDAHFVPIDENLASELIELSVEEMIRSAFEDETIKEDLKYLIRIFTSKTRFEDEIAKLIKNRKNVFTIKENIYFQNENKIAKIFSDTFSKFFLMIWKKEKKDFLNCLTDINLLVLENDGKNQTANEIKKILLDLGNEKDTSQILTLLESIKLLAFTKDISIRKKGYLKAALGEAIADKISFAENIMNELKYFELPNDHSKVELELAKFGLVTINFFDRALKIYEAKKKAESFFDFEDILIHTKILLQNEQVQKSLSEKFKFIMVDEFQDTNEIQYQIFLPILDHLKSGKLFIVGDEKQSIYKFRDAEIEIFNRTRNDIKEETGDNNLLNLPDSFRMTPAICTFCNHVFNKLFFLSDDLYGEVPPTDLVCARTDSTNGKIEFLLPHLDKTSAKEVEAEIVSQKILDIIKEGKYSWKDICILVRKRKNFSELEKSFLKNNIPYAIVGGRGFYQRQTISDIYNYLSFLADENNSPALVGILRSPFFSVSDSKLFEISLYKGSSFWRKLKNYVTEKKDLQDCLILLEENIKISSSIELSHLLKKIITDRNYLAIISARKDGLQESANIDKLISIARNFNSKGFRNLYDFITFLKDSISGLNDEAQAAFSSDLNAVQLMTIHQSKGLEFPIVFIYKSAETGVSGTLKSGQIQIDKKLGLLAKVPIDGNYLEEYRAAPVISIHNFIEEKKNLAELKRLFYVAVTRAKDELYISASIDEGKTFSKDSFLSLLNTGLDDQLLQEEIIIKDNLDYLTFEDGKYSTKKKISEISIPIIKQIDAEIISENEEQSPSREIKIQMDNLSSDEKGEIISASKVSIYNQCPLKYFLTYEYGFSKLNSYKLSSKNLILNFNLTDINEIENEEDERDDFSFQQKDSDDFDFAEYGKIVHSLLEKEISINDLDIYISGLNDQLKSDSANNEKLSEKLKEDLLGYLASNTYSEIHRIKNYKNEFEIYVKDDDYFLHGIIDKLAFDGKTLKIFDYKTDDIKERDIIKHADYYLMQLKFYLYIASRLFEGFEIFEGCLVFIKHPENPVKLSYDASQIKILQQEIKSIINSIRQKNNDKNTAHCSMCAYSGFTKKCIVN